MTRRLFARFAAYEPARLRAGWVAAVALLATQGISVSADVDARVQGVVSAVVVLLPWVQAELTRRAVYAPATTQATTVRAAELAQATGLPATQVADLALAGAAVVPGPLTDVSVTPDEKQIAEADAKHMRPEE